MSISPNKPAKSGNTLSPDQPGSAGRGREGRTPPPAPSAAYARRAREIMENEADLTAYHPSVEEDPEVIIEPVAAGYRRARAG